MQTRELFLDGYELYEANQGSFRIRGIGAIDRWFSRAPIPRAENRGVSACAQRASQLRSLEERLPLLGGPTPRLTCAAGRCVDRHDWRHRMHMKNAAGLGPRQRRQVQAMLGGGLMRREIVAFLQRCKLMK